MTTTVIIVAVLAYLPFHAGHAHASYRHGRARGPPRRQPLLVIGPSGTRIGHRL